jgi:hypothetical protein
VWISALEIISHFRPINATVLSARTLILERSGWPCTGVPLKAEKHAIPKMGVPVPKGNEHDS